MANLRTSRVFYLFYLLLLVSVACASKAKKNDTLHLSGSGSGPVRLLFLDWAYQYSTTGEDLNFHFERGSFAESLPLLSNGTLSFVQSWEGLTEKQRKDYPNLAQFPYLIVPSTFVYNIPDLKTEENEELVLSIEILAEIFLGEITTWRDPKILKLNPEIRDQIPNKKITSVTLSGVSTSILYQSRAFYRFSSKFRKAYPEPFDAWPESSLKKNKRLILAEGTFAPLATVQNTPYSVGLSSFAAFLLGSGGTLPSVRLRHQGKVIRLNQETGVAFLEKMRFDSNNDIEFNEGKKKHGLEEDLFYGWPLVGMSWLVLRNDYEKSECEYYQRVLRFFRWGLIAKEPRKAADDTGYYVLPGKDQKEVLKLLNGLKCNQESLLALQVVDDHDSSYFEALLALNWVMAFLTITPGILLFLCLSTDAKGQPVPSVAKLYSILLLLGALTVYSSVVFYYLVPDQDWICQLRQWLTAFGLTLFLGTLFTRTLQIHRIHRLAKARKMPSHRSNSAIKKRAFLDFLFGVGVTVPIQVIILVLWTIIMPLKAELKVIDDIDRTASWVCNCDDIWLWFGLEMGFFLCLLCYGVMVVYQTWDLKTNGFTESKWLLMAIYNLLLTVAALVPLFATLEIWDDKVFIIAAIGLNFAVASTLCCLYIQRGGAWIEKLVWQWRTSSRSGITTSPNNVSNSLENGSTTKSGTMKTVASNSMSIESIQEGS